MDFAIDINDGIPSMTWEKADSISNNIYLSVNIPQGAFVFNPGFGLRRRPRMKNTEKSAALIRGDYLEALQWIVASGRAKSVEVYTERDSINNPDRLKILVEAVQADGKKITFEHFVEVV